MDRSLGGPQSRSGRGEEEKNFQPLLGFEPPIIQPVAQIPLSYKLQLFWFITDFNGECVFKGIYIFVHGYASR
jgi:hypothetical protein